MGITFNKLGYSLEVGYQSPDYWYLHLCILLEQQGKMELIAMLEWYGKRDTTQFKGAQFHMEEGFNWFGCEWKPSQGRAFYSLNNVNNFAKIVNKIMNAVHFDLYGYTTDSYYAFYGIDPRQIVSTLEKRRVVRYYYDVRSTSYIPVDEIYPLYMKGWEAVGVGYSVIAEDERDARNKLSIEMPNSTLIMQSSLDKWFDDGRPVRQTNGSLEVEPGDSRWIEWYVGEMPVAD